jgi:hypothetical protein
MPALPNVNKVIRTDFLFTLVSGIPALSRQFYHYSGTAPTNADILTFADNAGAAFEASPAEDLSSDYTFLGVEATDLSSPTSAQALSSVSVNGGLSGSFLPQDICFVMAYEIARRYRGGHPRGYWPFGVEESLVDERTWDTSFVGQVAADLATMQGLINSGGWSGAGTIKQVSVSYFHGFTVVVNPTTGRARNVPTVRGVPVVDDVTQYVGRPLVGTQRRRIGR